MESSAASNRPGRATGAKTLPQSEATTPSSQWQPSQGGKRMPTEWLASYERWNSRQRSAQESDEECQFDDQEDQSDDNGADTPSYISDEMTELEVGFLPPVVFKISPIRPGYVTQKSFYTAKDVMALLSLTDEEFAQLGASIDLVLGENQDFLNTHWRKIASSRRYLDKVSSKLREVLPESILKKLTAFQPQEAAGYLVYKMFTDHKNRIKRALKGPKEAAQRDALQPSRSYGLDGAEEEDHGLLADGLELEPPPHQQISPQAIRQRRHSHSEQGRGDRQQAAQNRFSYAGHENERWYLDLQRAQAPKRLLDEVRSWLDPSEQECGGSMGDRIQQNLPATPQNCEPLQGPPKRQVGSHVSFLAMPLLLAILVALSGAIMMVQKYGNPFASQHVLGLPAPWV
ncbi:hypothetical protein TWF281_006619 [Arthrobotrys megalospora]